MQLLLSKREIRLLCIGCVLVCLPGAVVNGATTFAGRNRDVLRAGSRRPCAGGISGETSAQVRTLLSGGARRPAGAIARQVRKANALRRTSSPRHLACQRREVTQLHHPLRHRVCDLRGDDPPA
jgi:hypothetical protein